MNQYHAAGESPPYLSDPPPRMTTRKILVPGSVVPSLEPAYLRIARAILKSNPTVTGAELERLALGKLDEGLGGD